MDMETKNHTDNIQEQKSEPEFADALLLEEPQEVQAGYFGVFGLSSLLYALVYTACMFHNSSGITMPVWIGATILYACITMKRMYRRAYREQAGDASPGQAGVQAADARLRAGSLFYIAVMLLIGIAACSTDNQYMICFDYIGFFVMLLLFLLHNFCDDSQWDFSKSLMEMAAAAFGAVGCLFVPFTDGYAFCREKRVRKNKTIRAVLIGLVLAVPCLLFLGFCLMCADAVFDAMVMRLFSGLRVPVKVFEVLCMLLFGYFSSYCGMRYLSRRRCIAAAAHSVRFDAVIAITFTGLLLVMYAVFSGIQVLYLFAGNRNLPKGLTYAAYAQRGFYMLLFVCMVNLALVLFLKKYFVQHKLLDGMLLLICVCTFLMIASSAYRMYLYIAVYQLTFLRVLVLAALAVMVFLMAGVSVVILRPRFPLFRYSLAVVSTVYLCLAFLHVDNLVASYNLSHAQDHAETMDWAYLAGLSMDAAPAAADYYSKAPRSVQKQMEQGAAQAKLRASDHVPGQEAGGVQAAYSSVDTASTDWFEDYMYKVYKAQRGMGIRNLNFSRYRAVRLLQKLM